MTLVVGVDGGGTRTRAVLADAEGRELGRGESGGAVVGVDSAPRVAEQVEKAARAAAEQAGESLPVSGMWAGLAGAGRDEGRLAIARELGAAELAEWVVVGSDVEAAFHDAFGSGPGILLIAGTGSIAWARGPGGDVVRVGGWGERLGDEGGGWAIGMAALRAVVRAEDGRGAATALSSRVLEHLSLDRPEELIAWTASAGKGEVAGLARVVSASSSAGDQVARAILDAAVSDLAGHLDAVLERAGPWPEPPGLVLWGGLLTDGGPLRQAVERDAAARPVRLLTRAVDPAMGAVGMALAGLRQAQGRS